MTTTLRETMDQRARALYRQTSSRAKNDTIQVTGYQSYVVDKLGKIEPINNPKMSKQLQVLSKVDFKGCETLLDIGCNNGFFGLWCLYKSPVNRVCFVDQEENSITNIQKVLRHTDRVNNTTSTENFVDVVNGSNKYDAVLVFSLIHWVYSYTTEMGCLFEIVKKLRGITNKVLIIEFVDPQDSCIKLFKHIDTDTSVHKSAYTRANFEQALHDNFKQVTCLGATNTPTRIMYLAHC